MFNFFFFCHVGTITSGGRIGERRSISGTRLNMGSPSAFMPGVGSTLKTSTESLKHTERPIGFGSVSRQSLIDIVSARINAHRNKAPQVSFNLENIFCCLNFILKSSKGKLCRQLNFLLWIK